MKQLKLISTLFIILTSLFSCMPPATFTEPQPVDTKNISKFPKRLQGVYVNTADTADHSILSVSDKLVQVTYDFDYKVHPNQLDSASQPSGDTIIHPETKEKTKIVYDGDSIVIHVHRTDTLFQLDCDNVVRKFKGCYFFNTRYKETSWIVHKVQLSRGQLVISSISGEHDIDNLKEIAETSIDTIPPYQFTMTKKQFKKFVKNGGFSESEVFVKQ